MWRVVLMAFCLVLAFAAPAAAQVAVAGKTLHFQQEGISYGGQERFTKEAAFLSWEPGGGADGMVCPFGRKETQQFVCTKANVIDCGPRNNGYRQSPGIVNYRHVETDTCQAKLSGNKLVIELSYETAADNNDGHFEMTLIDTHTITFAKDGGCKGVSAREVDFRGSGKKDYSGKAKFVRCFLGDS